MTTETKHAVIGRRGYSLYYGEVVSFDPDRQVAEVRNCRHICRWYGGTGGISSLAAWGPCGPKKDQSRIGAPAPLATLTEAVCVYYCSEEAIEAFASIEASRE